MVMPTAVMAIIAVILLVIGYIKGAGQHLAGMRMGLGMAVQTLPPLLCAFIVAGLLRSDAAAGLILF
jgi:hypothetical protein